MRTDVQNRVVQGVGEGASIVCGVAALTCSGHFIEGCPFLKKEFYGVREEVGRKQSSN